MRKVLLLLAVALALSACHNAAPGDVDRYVRNHEPKIGGPDL